MDKLEELLKPVENWIKAKLENYRPRPNVNSRLVSALILEYQKKEVNRIKLEIKNIELILSDWEEEYKQLSTHIDNHDECIHLFDQIRKYSNYKTALEQVVNGFPIEVGSY